MPQSQKIPTIPHQREALRQSGQFWTPDWVAQAMVGYVFAGGHRTIFDPAVGAGAFFHAAKTVAGEIGCSVQLHGTELDSGALVQAHASGLSADDLHNVTITDFALNPPREKHAAIVGNPPYIRHHRLEQSTKQGLRAFCNELLGKPLDGRAGLHVYFLLRALALLAPNGRLAFILPADTVEGVFADPLWQWITRHYRLDAVITFAQAAAPFPAVDTNAIIVLLANETPRESFRWLRCVTSDSDDLKYLLLTDFRHPALSPQFELHERSMTEGLRTGLSRSPQAVQHNGLVLGDFARVMRGIATGANNFFFLTQHQARDLQLPDDLLLPALGRTRDVPGAEITAATLQAARAAGRPTLLFAPDNRPLAAFAPAVQRYLAHGVAQGLPNHALIQQRRPWYKMETRAVPPFLFAYLGRRSARFIRNQARVMPLTSFLCVYPHNNDGNAHEQLWQILCHPQTVANLALVGKSYGSGAIKVEPRALERLPLPSDVVAQAGLVNSLASAYQQLVLV